ncbi:PEP-CTERM sorting domain-containing protein [Aquabacterium sp. CECT 9606]|uniref:PEP-CTERM sorting domain-containing protein n=1 Tax=Aquabacterium sp. CECT 9606 TaxID=2845822 RepID=UPI001E54210E|nr:PEP-CTERM sorting domain-containing protein [Aquabacterium sp. CECT 9606]CAH0352894.1 hypothetical protein AQB9606_02888 [Aquabacterium sp. CECT 9606]
MSLNKFVCAGLLTAGLSCLTPAMAAPVSYTFSTGAAIGGPAELTHLLSGLTVSGSFVYDQTVPLLGSSGDLGFEPGYSIYATPGSPDQAFRTLTGSVGAYQFSDIAGSASIRNANTGVPSATMLDIISLTSDPTVKAGTNTTPADYDRQLQGFTLGNYTLHNVRLYWIGGVGGGAFNFLSDSALPAELPTFQGRLAFDFVRTDDPTNLANIPYYSNTVTFGGLTVQAAAVPETDTYLMALVGLGLVGVAVRRRQQRSLKA